MNDPLLTPEVRQALAHLLRPLQTYEAAKLDALLLAVQSAVLSAERERLLGLTEAQVVEAAAKAMWMSAGFGKDEPWETRNPRLIAHWREYARAALPLLVAPERARRQKLEERIGRLEEPWTDEHGTAWLAPTAHAYAMVCRALDGERAKREQAEAVTLRNLMGWQKEEQRATAAEAERDRLRVMLQHTTELAHRPSKCVVCASIKVEIAALAEGGRDG